MPYMQKLRETKDKKIIVIDKYYSFMARPLGKKLAAIRNPQEKESPEDLKRRNKKRATERTALMIANNFSEGSPYLTVTYDSENLPDYEDLSNRVKKDLRNFLDRLKRAYSKKGVNLKYAATVENVEPGKRGRAHAHLLLPEIPGVKTDREYERIFKSIWGKGNVKVQQYGGEMTDATKLAAYFLKQAKKDGGARMNFSRNCDAPTEKKTEVRRSECFSSKIDVPAGYFVNKELTFQGWTRDGYPCQHIVLEQFGESVRRYWDFDKCDYRERRIRPTCGKQVANVYKAVNKRKLKS
nr:MAG TPA: protein of unknown function DUF1424 [Caudoviricetes sp.]